MCLVFCEDASFAYDGTTVIQGLHFSVEREDYLCIVGENGAGKSTLMKGLLRLKKPSSGRILLGDGLTSREIGYLPQQTDVQRDFPSSVYEVVLSGCLNRLGWKPFYSSREKALAKENMERLGIASLHKSCYRELSGGQQQRVLLARALCAAQKLLLLDEPAAGLDPVFAREFYALVQRIHEELGITVIMVSHDVHSCVPYAKHVLHLFHTQLFFGTSQEYQRSDVGRRFLGGASLV